jgi:hypothetical protein
LFPMSNKKIHRLNLTFDGKDVVDCEHSKSSQSEPIKQSLFGHSGLADLALVFRTIVELSYFPAASSNSASQIDRDLALSCSCSADMEQCKLCDYCEEPRAPRAACDQCEPTPFPRAVTFLRLGADAHVRVRTL